MKRWIIFFGLLGFAGIGLRYGLAAETGINTLWLSLTLVSVFAASDRAFWRSALR